MVCCFVCDDLCICVVDRIIGLLVVFKLIVNEYCLDCFVCVLEWFLVVYMCICEVVLVVNEDFWFLVYIIRK